MADEHDVAGEQQVGALRQRIDQIDDQLMKLLNARSACAVEIGRIKRRAGMAVYQPDREKWILERVPKFPGATRWGHNNWWVHIANTDEDLPELALPDPGRFVLPDGFAGR